MHQLKEDSPMSRRLVVAMLDLGMVLFLRFRWLLKIISRRPSRTQSKPLTMARWDTPISLLLMPS